MHLNLKVTNLRQKRRKLKVNCDNKGSNCKVCPVLNLSEHHLLIQTHKMLQKKKKSRKEIRSAKQYHILLGVLLSDEEPEGARRAEPRARWDSW